MTSVMKVCLLTLTAIVCLSLIVSQATASPVDKTVVSDTTTEKSTKRCNEGNPCGWAVYGNNKLKKTQYFIRNTCLCQKEHGCLLSNEDLSLSAYVYRCTVRTNPEDA